MDETKCKLTVCFEDPFWVGIYERSEGGKLEVSRTVFGAEPKDYEVCAYFLENWNHLRFSPPLAVGVRQEKSSNPKRVQRAIAKQMTETGAGTKAQQALKLQQEQGKNERKSDNRRKMEEEKARDFEIRQQKKKEKHRGR
ncbi:MAG: DUF2992 family protein [Clostridia bacterium]|nr:DUF2992 family protein [Clostridia bacterium]